MSRTLPYSWGSTVAEGARHYPADDLIAGRTMRLTRAVDVAAPAELAYRWLCQVAVAPYSYDLLDNLGRRSPQHLTDGADQLEVGQPMMVFQLTDVQPGRQFTGTSLPGPQRLFGRLAATYAVEPVDASHSRLVCRLLVGTAPLLRRVTALPLAWGDLVMMRKQLLTLARLAARDAQNASVIPLR